jgi:DNA-binding CsgD family transcriptional regulator
MAVAVARTCEVRSLRSRPPSWRASPPRERQRAVSVADRVQHAAIGWQSRFWLAQALRARRPAEANEVQAEAEKRIDAIARELTDQALRERFLDSSLVRARRNVSPPAKASNPAGLSAREIEVLRLVASGTTNARIAEVLVICPRTVAVHITSILTKTGCANRAAAVAFALRHGIT